MLTITLPEHLADSHVLAGVAFADGIATVAELGSHTRHYFELVGATVAEVPEVVADDPDSIAALAVDGRLLTDCTVAELRDIADAEGIELPAKAKKPEILHAFLVAFQQED